MGRQKRVKPYYRKKPHSYKKTRVRGHLRVKRTKRTYRQTGKRKSIKRDRQRKAKSPGVRRSASGRRYIETRRNRSDRIGSRI